MLDELRTPTSTRRYRRGAIPGQADAAQDIIDEMRRTHTYIPRTSRTVYRRPELADTDDEDTEEEVTTTALRPGHMSRFHQPRRRTWRDAPHTEDDGEIRTHSGRRLPEPYRPVRKTHPFVYVGLCLAILVVWMLIISVFAWFMNTFHDPIYYCQTAHRDMVTVTDTAGSYQIRAFVDPQSRLDLLVMPTGQTGKARIAQGMVLSNLDDPQHAILTVRAHGTVITVVAQGPYQANVLSVGREIAQWSTDLHGQLASDKGGKS